MKKIITVAVLACLLCACENKYVISLLRGPSQLETLEIEAYNEEGALLQGGASIVPGFSPSQYEYTVYIPYEAVYFVVKAEIKGGGIVTWISDAEEEGNAFTLPNDIESKQVTVRGERDYMDIADYMLNVMHGPEIPRDITIGVTPGIASFFIKPAGKTHSITVEVSAAVPSDGGTLTYQWYRNSDNNNRTGEKISGATKSFYELTYNEQRTSGVTYYYAEITNNLNGQTSKMDSLPRSVTFIDKQKLQDKKEMDKKSFSMVDVPAGVVDPSDWTNIDGILPSYANYPPPSDGRLVAQTERWATPGFKMGANHVTWELWKLVFDVATNAGNYAFANNGRQGATGYGADYSVDPIGNKLHPVTTITWNDIAVWCNAYSEMDGLQAVYVDSEGNVLRNSRYRIRYLYDMNATQVKNGYRMPNFHEWLYALRGGVPGSPAWTYKYVNENGDTVNGVWGGNRELGFSPPDTTAEVGTLPPNSIGLYDMIGNVLDYLDAFQMKFSNTMTDCLAVGCGYNNSIPNGEVHSFCAVGRASAMTFVYVLSNPGLPGFRVVCGYED